jgi:lysozyme
MYEMTKRFEGLRLEAYQCPAGVWTIGYGHTKGVKKGDKITLEQAEAFLVDDMKEAEDGVRKLVRVPLTPNQFEALADFVFNLGIGNLGKSTLLKLLNTGDYAGAAAQLLRWNKSGGRELAGLTARRNEEAKLFMS